MRSEGFVADIRCSFSFFVKAYYNSMNRKGVDVALFPRGSNSSQTIHRSRIFFIYLSIVILVMLPCYESRARNTPSTQKLSSSSQTYKLHKSIPLSNYIEDDWEKSISIKEHKENVSISESPAVNFAFNEMDDNQLLIHNERNVPHKRFKRGVVHLYNMLVCATGCNPLAYKGYGCYCGFLGSGYVIDGIDRCCKMHDWCYDATECATFSEYFVPYYWRCYHGSKPVCAVEHGDWGGSGSCAQRLCECDRSFAECLKRYPCPTTKAVCTSSPWRLVQNLFMIM